MGKSVNRRTKEEDIESVKKYLRSLNYFYTDGLRYGLDLLVYTEHPDKVHSIYGMIVLNEEFPELRFTQVIALQRVCASVRKTFIIARIKDNKIELISVERFLT